MRFLFFLFVILIIVVLVNVAFITLLERKIVGYIELFIQKIVTKLSKIWVWDPGKPIPDPGSRGQKGSGSRIRNTGENHVIFPH